MLLLQSVARLRKIKQHRDLHAEAAQVFQNLQKCPIVEQISTLFHLILHPPERLCPPSAHPSFPFRPTLWPLAYQVNPHLVSPRIPPYEPAPAITLQRRSTPGTSPLALPLPTTGGAGSVGLQVSAGTPWRCSLPFFNANGAPCFIDKNSLGCHHDDKRFSRPLSFAVARGSRRETTAAALPATNLQPGSLLSSFPCPTQIVSGFSPPVRTVSLLPTSFNSKNLLFPFSKKDRPSRASNIFPSTLPCVSGWPISRNTCPPSN